MNNSTLTFTTPEASLNNTTHAFCFVDRLDIFLYFFNLLFGLPTHSYIMWLIVTGTGNGFTSGCFIFNLSVCEIGNCLDSLIYILDNCIWFSHFTTLLWFLLGVGVTGRPLFQCLMCVERYLAVVHPVTFLKYKPLRYRVICCTAAWIIIICSCVCSMFSFILNIDVYPWFFSPQFLLFFLIQLFCLVAVLRALKQSGPGERGREREEENHMKRRAFHIILINTVTMFIIYIPFIISGISVILTQQYIRELFSFGFICYILAGFVQPVLYLQQAGKLSCFCSPLC